MFSLLGRAVPFFLLPVLTRYLTPEDYGYVANFLVLVSLAIPFVGLNSHAAYARAFYLQDRFNISVYLGTVWIFAAVLGFIQVGIFWTFQREIGDFFFFPSSWVILVPITATSSVFTQLMLTCWQVREMPRQFGFFQNFQTLTEAVSSVLLVVYWSFNWLGRVLSRSVASLFFACFSLFWSLRKGWLELKFDKQCLIHGLKYGFPLIPHSLAGIINGSVDRVFISHMVGPADTGLYTVGYQIGAIIGLMAGSFNQAYVPWLFEKLKKNDHDEKRSIVKFTYVYFVVILALSLILGFGAPWFLDFFLGKKFTKSSDFVIWISLGYCFDGMYMMACNYIFFAEKTHVLALISLAGAFLNVILNYFFISWYGSIGAAQATAISFLLTFLMLWRYSSKVFKMPWALWRE